MLSCKLSKGRFDAFCVFGGKTDGTTMQRKLAEEDHVGPGMDMNDLAGPHCSIAGILFPATETGICILATEK